MPESAPRSAPRVTVLIPVRDAVTTVGRALESVCSQDGVDWEAVVVDDGSRDGTGELLDGLAARDGRLRVLRQERLGIVAALNAGIAASRGEFIARLDADDEMLPGRLASQAGALDAEATLGLVSCLVRFGGDRSLASGYALHVDWLNSIVEPEAIALNRFVESPFAHPSVMFRKSLVDRHGGYREGDFPEDYELWLRWSGEGVRMGKVASEGLVWNDPPNRLSRTDPRYSNEAFFRMKAPYLAAALVRMSRGRRLWVWGAGRLTRRRSELLERHGVRISGYVDVDPAKIGRRTPSGLPVIGAAELARPEEAVVLGYVSSRGAREFIRSQLGSRNFEEGRDFLMGA